MVFGGILILVTGGAGFIGSNLVHSLVARGEAVVVVDDLSDGHKFRNLSDCALADYFDRDELAELLVDPPSWLRSVKAVFHEGACSTTTEWDGRYMMRNNHSYSKQLLSHCVAHRIPFLYASSAAVYGTGRVFREEPPTEHPINVYGFSKKVFDDHVRRLPERESQVVGLRYFNVYGPREQHKGSMASVAFHLDGQLRNEGEVRLFEGSGGYGPGDQLRDFVHVDDVVAVNLWFLDHPRAAGIFNVGTGRAEPFNRVARTVLEFHGRGALRYVPFPEKLRDSYQSFTEADLSRLRATGCDVPFRDVRTGVTDYLSWLEANRREALAERTT